MLGVNRWSAMNYAMTVWVHDDILRIVFRNLDVRQLLSLKRVCKKFRRVVYAKGILYASMLTTFPGILGLPVERHYGVYIVGIQRYYGTYSMGFRRSEFDVSRILAECIARRHVGYTPAPLEGIVKSVMNSLMLFLYTDVDRRFVVDRINDWRASCFFNPGHFLPNAVDVLDAVSSNVSSNFRWAMGDTIACYW